MKIYSEIKPNPTIMGRWIFVIFIENEKGEIFSNLINIEDLEEDHKLILTAVHNLLWLCYPEEMQKDRDLKNYRNLIEGNENR